MYCVITMRQLAITCLVTAFLFVHRQVPCSALGCAQWKVFRNQLSTGSLREPTYKTVAACQNYCIQTTGCVAVDFGVNITGTYHYRQCWVHKDVVNLAPQNTRTSVANITQYRLNRTCGQPRTSTPVTTRVCTPKWRTMNDTNANGALPSDSFKVPDVETCKSECSQAVKCVAVDVDVRSRPMVCWPHYRPDDLKDGNIFGQKGTNFYQLTGSCAPNCVSQWIVVNDANADGAEMYINVTSVEECRDSCTKDLNCVAVDVDHKENPLRCWRHFDVGDIRHDNIYHQQGTSLHIPVKRCIASLYWAKTTSMSPMRSLCSTSMSLLLLLLLLMLVFLTNSRHDTHL